MKPSRIQETTVGPQVVSGGSPAAAGMGVPVTRSTGNTTSPIMVDLAGGRLFGYTEQGVHTFRGVPYARAARFMRAKPVEPWEGPYPALIWGANCPSSANDSMSRLEFENFSGSNLPQNEDCLFANVWTTSTDASANLPVIMFIHGGQYATGSSNQLAYYEGKNLAARGSAVFVSVNHRLNVLGYTDLSEFGEEYADSGNLGQFDLIEAMRWVRSNIAAFGGDPNNVTLVGQSGGGGKILTLMGMPEAQGLFHKAYVSSAAPGWRDADQAREQTRRLMQEVGASNPEQLAKLPFLEILEAAKRTKFTPGPVAGTDAFPQRSFTQDGMFTDLASNIPLIVTTNLGEFNSNLGGMTGFITNPGDPLANNYIPQLTRKQIDELIVERFGGNAEEIVEAFSMAYPSHARVDVLFMETGAIFGRVRNQILAAKARQGGAPVFGGVVAKNFPVFGGVTPGHTSGDIPFLFANDKMMTRLTAGDESSFAKLTDELSGALLAFAATGNPSLAGLEWPQYTSDTEALMVFDVASEPRDHHEQELYRLFAEINTGQNFSAMPSA